MTRNDWFGIVYVSVLVMIWGTVGSLVDLPFLNSKVYLAGSLGQVTTFVVTALVTTIIGVWIYPKTLKSGFVISAFGLNTSQPK
tara:strand:- start:305 stop:556 length:252 start_codon:yes stop_codon:yes gene_type:complete